jgi:multidrug efflux pump subunit AcrB
MTQPPNYRRSTRRTTVHDYLDNIFIQALSKVPGVAQASIIGDQKPSIRVQVDPAKLASIGLTLEEVRAKLVGATSNAAKGTIFTPQGRLHPRGQRPNRRGRAVQRCHPGLPRRRGAAGARQSARRSVSESCRSPAN